MTHCSWWDTPVSLGLDYAQALIQSKNRSSSVVTLPELPQRGVEAQLPARTATIAGCALNRGVRGWELRAQDTLISRRARSYWSEEQDFCAEFLEGTSKIIIPALGPWSAAAWIEYRGHSLIADPPAFKDFSLSLAYGYADYARQLHKTMGAKVGVAVWEPMLTPILDGLSGDTPWSAHKPIPTAYILRVWSRMLSIWKEEGLEGATLDDHGAMLREMGKDRAVIEEFYALGWDQLVISEKSIETNVKNKDTAAHLIEQGQDIAWGIKIPADSLIPPSSQDSVESRGEGQSAQQIVDHTASSYARSIMRQWEQWSFESQECASRMGLALLRSVPEVMPRYSVDTRTFALSPAILSTQTAVIEHIGRYISQ